MRRKCWYSKLAQASYPYTVQSFLPARFTATLKNELVLAAETLHGKSWKTKSRRVFWKLVLEMWSESGLDVDPEPEPGLLGPRPRRGRSRTLSWKSVNCVRRGDKTERRNTISDLASGWLLGCNDIISYWLAQFDNYRPVVDLELFLSHHYQQEQSYCEF